MPAYSSNNLSPAENSVGSDALLELAFDKSWRFIDKDPFLAHISRSLLRDQLKKHLEQLFRKGEQELLSLANSAINRIRAEFVPEIT